MPILSTLFTQLGNYLGSYFKQVLPPVGSIVAWHGSLFTTLPTLPSGWALCDGGVINDSASPLNGKTRPLLNSPSTGRMLVGNTTSGTLRVMTTGGTDFSYYTADVIWIIRYK